MAPGQVRTKVRGSELVWCFPERHEKRAERERERPGERLFGGAARTARCPATGTLPSGVGERHDAVLPSGLTNVHLTESAAPSSDF